ncbi:hypothetical protein K788_00015960 [Paraburkholderia caribensis MBA4]|uniref:Uncharacterized protein n=1 Tax=Paraburkholderia caribensis MBA4 TaxID=1323664 RepID=A0A0P0REA1_9BURK|nr:hypothetical protein K788_00015960 [Paraburkholderia caribensis MBA4]
MALTVSRHIDSLERQMQYVYLHRSEDCSKQDDEREWRSL